MTEYCMSLSHELEDRLKLKCDTLSDAFVLDDIGKCKLHITNVINEEVMLILPWFIICIIC